MGDPPPAMPKGMSAVTVVLDPEADADFEAFLGEFAERESAPPDIVQHLRDSYTLCKKLLPPNIAAEVVKQACRDAMAQTRKEFGGFTKRRTPGMLN